MVGGLLRNDTMETFFYIKIAIITCLVCLGVFLIHYGGKEVYYIIRYRVLGFNEDTFVFCCVTGFGIVCILLGIILFLI